MRDRRGFAGDIYRRARRKRIFQGRLGDAGSDRGMLFAGLTRSPSGLFPVAPRGKKFAPQNFVYGRISYISAI